MEKLQRKMKSYRFNEYVDNCVTEISNNLKINKTLFYEMAVIEKMAKLDICSNEKQFLINYIDYIIKELETAKNRLKKGN